MKHIAIFDLGSQYTHLIAREIRKLKVFAFIYPAHTKAETLKGKTYGIILSGGPQSVYDKGSIKVDPNIFKLGIPVLGICYGHQLIGHFLGGKVGQGEKGEFGKAGLSLVKRSKIFKNISENTTVWMSHGDSVTAMPEGFSIIGSTNDCEVTAMSDEKRDIYGFQFHPEVMHTTEGETMLNNFVVDICNAKLEWNVQDMIGDLIAKIQRQVGNKKVFILVSGGVDSNVAFAILTKALGEKRVKGLYIDTGFMRMKESEEILDNFRLLGFHNLESVNAADTFFARLKNIYDPEKKRHNIGQTFLDVKDKVAEDLDLEEGKWLLGQGTIYPDTIESGGTKHADKIKTHHNRVDAIQKLIAKGMVVEPLVDFYKDEVREIGELLDLPEKLVKRHPFPGPGLAIRCLCHEASKPFENIKATERETGKLFEKEYPGISHKLLPLRSVGVQGDSRTYAHPLVVWGEHDWEKLDGLSSNVTNTIRKINRVIVAPQIKKNEKPEFVLPKKNKYITRDRIALLQEIDAIVNKAILDEGIYDDIWQFPVVLIPILDKKGKESIVLRPFNSRDVMTFNFYRMAPNILNKIIGAITRTGKISYVFYDITNKPPGTTEWE